MTSVMAEALLVGVISSVVGIFAGLGVAKLIALLFDALGFGLPVGSRASVSARSSWRW